MMPQVLGETDIAAAPRLNSAVYYARDMRDAVPEAELKHELHVRRGGPARLANGSTVETLKHVLFQYMC